MTTGEGIRLPGFPAATGFSDTDLVFMTQNNATVKGTIAQLRAALATNATIETFVAGPSFTASISGTTMTVTAFAGGAPLAIGQTVFGAGVTGSPTITSLGTGTGAAGTYTLSAPLGSISSEAMGAASATQFAPGFSTSITLAGTYGSAANAGVYFDDGRQWDCTLTGQVLGFNPTIPFGVQAVYVSSRASLPIGTPANDSVGDAQLTWGNVLNRVVDSIAALSALNPAIYTRAFVTGYYAVGDGGGGSYYYSSSTSQASANAGSIIAASGGTGCWLLEAAATVSVRQFGAKGNGAANDRPAILAAVTYVNSIGGGRVYYPAGTYGVMASVVLSNINNVESFGDGIEATSIKALSAGTFTNGLYTFSGGSFVKCSGILFNVNNMSVGTLTPAIYFGAMTDIEVSDCEVAHMSTIGIGTSTCSNVRILRNKITLDVAFNSQNNGILISGTSSNVWIEENNLNRTNILVAASNCWITNNVCQNYKYGAGIGVSGDSPGISGPYYVIGNTCSGGVGVDTDGTYVAGMEFNGVGGVCANNACFNNSGVGIASFSFASIIANNSCYNNGTGGSPIHCAGISGAYQSSSQFFSQNTIVGNVCSDTGPGTQLYGYQDAGDTRCVGNTFSGNNFQFNHTAQLLMASVNSYSANTYSGILAYAGGTVTAGTSSTFNVSVPNANLGDFAIGSLDSYGGAGSATFSAYCIGSNTVCVTVANVTASTITLPAGNFRAIVLQHYN